MTALELITLAGNLTSLVALAVIAWALRPRRSRHTPQHQPPTPCALVSRTATETAPPQRRS